MELKKAIKNTIEYAAKFGSHVNKKEIKGRLISNKVFSKKELDGCLEQLKYKNRKNRYYQNKFRKAVYLAKKIENNFEDILFLGLSGSVASKHPKKDDDIDFLIITRTNKLWATRLKIRWWIFKNHVPHRKYGEKEKKNDFCFNLWIDNYCLRLPKNRQNLRNSVDLILLRPLINKENTYEKFVLANDWAKKWVATPYKNKISNFQFPISNKKQKTNKFKKMMNYLYFWPQYWYMRAKMRGETVGLYQAFFHR